LLKKILKGSKQFQIEKSNPVCNRLVINLLMNQAASTLGH